MVGDGHTGVHHCERADVIGEGYEPDANSVYCAALSQQAEPRPSRYSDVVSDGGMDPRNEPAPAQDELKPCPFCGETLRINKTNLAVHSRGSDCLLRQQPVVMDDPQQVKRWNARPAQTWQQPVVLGFRDERGM